MTRLLTSMLLALCLSACLAATHTAQVRESQPMPLLTQTRGGQAAYGARLTGPDGEPIAGAAVQLCDDTSCMLLFSDEAGWVRFERTPYPYEAHVLRTPQGYAADPGSVYILPAGGGEIQIPISREQP